MKTGLDVAWGEDGVVVWEEMGKRRKGDKQSFDYSLYSNSFMKQFFFSAPTKYQTLFYVPGYRSELKQKKVLVIRFILG